VDESGDDAGAQHAGSKDGEVMTNDKDERCHGPEVHICPLHRAAPEMLEALKAVDRAQDMVKLSDAFVIVRAAIAKAEGKE